MAKSPFDYRISYKAYTHSNDRVSEKDYVEFIKKGDKIHNNTLEMLLNLHTYGIGGFDRMHGGYRYYSVCKKV